MYHKPFHTHTHQKLYYSELLVFNVYFSFFKCTHFMKCCVCYVSSSHLLIQKKNWKCEVIDQVARLEVFMVLEI
jgi:hypothetical protein